jgi:uncharacterized membrane protein
LGCSLSLHIPLCSALTALNGVQSEIGSAIFCYACVYPTPCISALYVIFMMSSNIIGVYLGWVIFQSPVSVIWSGTYLSVAIVLCIMRTVSIRGFFRHPDPMSHLKLKDN